MNIPGAASSVGFSTVAAGEGEDIDDGVLLWERTLTYKK